MSVHVYIVATGNDKEQLLDKVLTLYCLFQLMGAWGELSLSLRIIQWKYTGHGDKVPQILNTLWLVAPCSPNSAVATFSAPFHYAPTPHPTDSYLFIPIWQESLTFWILCTLLFNYDIWRDYWSTDLYMATSFFFFFGYLIYRNRFEQVWVAQNFKNTEFQDGNSETLYEVHPLYEYFVCHIQDICKSE